VATTASQPTPFEGIPEGARPLIRRGFEVASSITPEVRTQVLEYVFQQFSEQKTKVDAERVAKDTGLPVRDTASLISAFSVIIAYYTSYDASVDEFIETARDIIFDPASEATVREVVNIIDSRKDILSKSFERTAVSNAVLPSLTIFDVIVDSRLILKDDNVQDIVSVVVARIDTDYDNSQIVVQLSKSDIADIIKKLNDALKEMNLAEGLISRLQQAPSE
jgi:hypothetical protein